MGKTPSVHVFGILRLNPIARRLPFRFPQHGIWRLERRELQLNRSNDSQTDMERRVSFGAVN